jgi:hypothetical protein
MSREAEAGSGMTDIDPKADIELHTVNEHVIVRLPLAGPVTDEWLQRYQRLARATGVPAQAEAAWVVVSVQADGSQREVAATMDAARALIGEADAGERAPAASPAESIIRDWWARRRESGPRRPTAKTKLVRTGIGIEQRWPLLSALVVAIILPLLLPARFSLGPDWIIPAVDVLLLVAIVVADRTRDDHRPVVVRVLSVALMVVFVADAAGVTARLVADLIEGGPETNSPSDLLRVGFGVWVYTILAFAFLYWVLDGGGPDARLWTPPAYPDLAFPEQLNSVVAAPGWRPQFFDYLYLGFTNATAFSPTDVMPLARWAKAVMTVQAAGSLAVLGLVIARAVNILQ